MEAFINPDLKFYVIGLYRPPDSNINAFLEEFETFLGNNFQGDDKIILIGDLNVDLSVGSGNGLELTDVLSGKALEPLICEPTRVTLNSSTIIDHIWTNMDTFFNSGVFECDISDHFLIFTCFKVPPYSEKILKYFRDHSAGAFSGLRVDACRLINEIFPSMHFSCFDYKVTYFFEKFNEIYDKNCPIRCKNICTGSNKPYINDYMCRVLKFKQFLYVDYRKKYIPHFVYKNFKNRCTKMLKKSKETYIKSKFENSTDSKTTWKNINTFFRNSGSQEDNFVIEDSNGFCTDEKIIGEKFNNYFASIAGNLDRNIPQTNRSFSSYLDEPNIRTFFVKPSSGSEVKKIILKSENKSSMLDEIPISVFKHIVDLVSPLFSNMFNESILTGTFPSIFKTSRIRPVFKRGDNRSLGNYRPLSITPFISKLFERLMYVRINNFLSKYELLCPHQFGFRANHSTSDVILEYLNNVYESLNSGRKMITVFIDLSKAFDTVNHLILVKKLEVYGIRGIALRWFESYLNGRSHFVAIGRTKSGNLTTNIGIPQGSVLGPLLFNMYINDMFKSCTDLKLLHYADDTTAFFEFDDFRSSVGPLNSALGHLYEWLSANRLTLNISKTSYMIHGNINFNPNDGLDICIANQVLTKTSSANFLGVIIDDKLRFEDHVNKLRLDLSKVAGVVWTARTYLPKKLLRTIYLSLAWSKLTYGILVWGRCSLTRIGKIRKIQNRIIRTIYGSHTLEVYHNNQLFTLEETYDLFCMVKFFKIMNDVDCNSYFVERIHAFQVDHHHQTRAVSNQNLTLPFYRNSRFQNSFLYQGLQLWNNLPLAIRNIHRIGLFKSNVRLLLLDNT